MVLVFFVWSGREPGPKGLRGDQRYALKGERDLCVRCRPIREQTTPRWYPLAKSITKQMRSEMSSDADTEKD